MKKKNITGLPIGNRTGAVVAPQMAEELVEDAALFSPEPSLDNSEADGILMDKLGARLAFERTGVRLYDALIQKRMATGGAAKPTVQDLQHIRDEELQHTHALEACILDLGGDPTVVTPAADIAATMSAGALKVAADPRTTIPQCLEAILTAELVDNDCWGVLIKLMEVEGMDDEVENFQEALAEEQEHLQTVRKWILASVAPEAA